MAYLRDNVLASLGWINADETWTYASADDPTYTFTVPTDLTGKYAVGMRIKLTQSTGGTKYFIITKVAYGAPNTTVTIYGGTDYNLENEAISSPFYSIAKAPLGFPLDPTKWTVRVTNANFYTQADPTADAWYNLNAGLAITIPIGVWYARYQVNAGEAHAGVATIDVATTLSTANNSESDADWTARAYWQTTGAYEKYHDLTFYRSKAIVVASKTAYYLNTSASNGGAGFTIYNGSYANDRSPTILEAVSAYL